MRDHEVIALPALLQNRVAALAAVSSGGGEALAGGTIGTPMAAEAGGTIRVRFERGELDVPSGGLAPLEVGVVRSLRGFGLAYCAVVGSRAHGLGHDESDIDRRGFYIPAAALHFSLRGVPEQLVHDADQLCFWEVEKFIRLALKANPTVLETLFSPAVEIATPAARRLLEMREAFLSKLAYRTFLGYADAQFAKMERAREQGSVFKWRHAMHLIRLLHAGIDLAGTGRLDIVVPEERRADLLAIKRGEWAWEEVTRLRARLVTEFEEAFRRTPLPDEPDAAAADRYLVELRLEVARAANGTGADA